MINPNDQNPVGESKSSRLRLPRVLWLALIAVVLAIAGVVLSVWVPYQGRQVIVAELERLGGVHMRQDGPRWLRNLTGDQAMKVFDQVDFVEMHGDAVTDEKLRLLSTLSSL